MQAIKLKIQQHDPAFCVTYETDFYLYDIFILMT